MDLPPALRSLSGPGFFERDCVESDTHFLRAGRTARRVLLQTVHDQVLERSWNRQLEPGRGSRRRRVSVVEHHLHYALSRENQLAGKQPVPDTTQRIQVDAMVS